MKKNFADCMNFITGKLQGTFGSKGQVGAGSDNGRNNHRGYDAVDFEIETELDNLDMITASAMAIMLSDAKVKASSPYIKDLEKPDINDILRTFLRETYHIADIGQLDKLFSSKYYRQKIKKYLRKAVVFVRRGISDSLPKRNMWLIARTRVASKQTKTHLEKICESIGSFETVKYIPALSGNKEISDSKRNYKLDHLSDNYKDALIYIVDVLLTCTCISKILFVERMIRKMPADSEFARIIDNISGNLGDHNVIISKTRPIYKQFYRAELGNLDGDDLLYGMAVTIMVNNIKKTEIKNKDMLSLDVELNNAHELNQDMMKWLDALAVHDYAIDVGTLILQRTTLLVKKNTILLLYALGELLDWESFYNERVAFYIKARDKERYLKGDLNKEILEISQARREKEKLN